MDYAIYDIRLKFFAYHMLQTDICLHPWQNQPTPFICLLHFPHKEWTTVDCWFREFMAGRQLNAITSLDIFHNWYRLKRSAKILTNYYTFHSALKNSLEI